MHDWEFAPLKRFLSKIISKLLIRFVKVKQGTPAMCLELAVLCRGRTLSRRQKK
jgi:hypothetical protein